MQAKLDRLGAANGGLAASLRCAWQDFLAVALNLTLCIMLTRNFFVPMWERHALVFMDSMKGYCSRDKQAL